MVDKTVPCPEYVNGENTVVTDPDKNHCEKALKSLDHLVVVDIFLTETAQMADIVLPASAWGETDLHLTHMISHSHL